MIKSRSIVILPILLCAFGFSLNAFSTINGSLPLIEIVNPPKDTVITCLEFDPFPEILEVIDDCVGEVSVSVAEVSTRSNNVDECSYNSYEVTRIYTVTNACDEELVYIQNIVVVDTMPPDFNAPVDVTIACSEINNIEFTGIVGGVVDQCGGPTYVNFNDEINGDLCNSTFNRIWNLRDVCGNISERIQRITVVDTIPPAMVNGPEDISVFCSQTNNPYPLFNQWVKNLGNTIFEDCNSISSTFPAVPGSYDLSDMNTFPGIHPGGLDSIKCGDMVGVLQNESVDFVFVDACGNASAFNATFYYLDDIEPSIDDCSEDITVNILGNSCDTVLTFDIPQASDACVLEDISISVLDIEFLSSSNPGATDIPVNDLNFRIGPFSPEIPFEESNFLHVELNNIDADQEGEVFEIYDEDGNFIRNTPLTSAQCDSINFDLGPFSKQQMEAWAFNGTIEFNFVTKLNQIDSSLTINDICTNSNIRIYQDYVISRNISDVEIYLGIDDRIPFKVEGLGVSFRFDPGKHNVRFIARDCAGNESICTKVVSVFENNIPELICSPDITLESKGDTCLYPILVSDLFSANENCEEPIFLKLDIIGAMTESYDEDYDSIKDSLLYLSIGMTEIRAELYDFSGNSVNCEVRIQVFDVEPPQAICIEKNIPVIAAALESLIIPPIEVAGESTDNCGISNIVIIDNSYSCFDLNRTIGREVRVIDNSGNVSTCTANFFLEEARIPISYTVGLCPNDPIQFHLNLDQDEDYAYQWNGPSGFFSVEAEPFIPMGQSIHQGEYKLTVTNTSTLCASYANIEVNIDEIKNPIFSTDTVACEVIPHRLESTEILGDVTYNWNELIDNIIYPVASSTVPFIDVLLPPGKHDLFVNVSDGNCVSPNSNLISVDVREQPVGAICNAIIEACIGDPLTLCVQNPKEDWIIDWQGPNGFSSSEPNPVVTDSFSSPFSGVYRLVIENNSCITDTLTTSVTTNIKPQQPMIIGQSKYCDGDTLVLASSEIKNGYIYTWDTPAGEIRTPEPVLRIPNISSTYSGNWNLTIESDPCFSIPSQSFNVFVEEDNFLGIAPVPTQCEDTEITLQTSFIPGGSYTWSGPNGFNSNDISPTLVAMPGSYSVNITSSNGCEYFDIIDVNTIVVPEIFSVTVNELGECINSFTTIDVIPQINSTQNLDYFWSGPNGFTTNEVTLSIEDYTSDNNGSYSLSVENGDCVSDVFTFDLAYTVSPVKPIISANPVVCIGDKLEFFTGNYEDGSLFLWNTPTGTIETTVNSLVIDEVTEELEGNYRLTVIKDGCPSPNSDALFVTVNQNNFIPDIFIEGEECLEASFTLFTNLDDELPLEWELPNGQNILTDSLNIDFALLSNVGEYKVRSFFNGCPSEWSPIYTVDFDDPRVGVSLNEGILFSCNNDDAFLELCVNDENQIEGKIYKWTIGSTVIGETTSSCLPVMDFSIFEIGLNEINLSLELDGCVLSYNGKLSLEIEDTRSLDLDAGPDQLFCVLEELFMEAEESDSDILSSFWSFDAGISISDITDPNAIVIVNEDIESTNLIWNVEHIECGIVYRDTVLLSQKIGPNLVPDTFYFDDQQLVFNPLENDLLLPGNEYEVSEITEPRWGSATLSGDIITFNTDSKFVGGPIEFDYIVCDRDCPTLCGSQKILVYYNQGSCQGNNVLTANGDGVNDIFIIPCIDEQNLPENELTVINELGNIVYQKTPYDNSWDGTFNGQYLPEGTYYYIFTRSKESSIIQGFISIEK